MASDSVKVAVRVRPFNQRELNAGSPCIIAMDGNVTTITNPENGDKKTFAFDHSYWSCDGFKEDSHGVSIADGNKPYADQQNVFKDLGQGVLDNAWEGYNAALFAYGQTGSGKSYSMIGYGANKGIVPITCGELFKAFETNKDEDKEFQVTFSMLEIYNEQVRDLLVSTKNKQGSVGSLKVRLHPKTGFYVEGLKQVPVESYSQIEAMMEQGTLNRTTASTHMNATSSRSHMVISITFKQVYTNELGESTTKSSQINLVDLAGSERADSTGATGDRLKEGSAINQSLSTLGKVISALADDASGKKKVVVPYRESVLTKLLMSALGGNSRTIMIAALSPAGMNYEETLSTLRYADRAKRIQNKAVVNESPTEKLIRELKEENMKLMQQLKEMQGGADGSIIQDLRQQLAENEKEMEAMHQTWDQRLEEAQREWEESTPRRAKSSLLQHPYLQNINEDPQLSGIVKFCLEPGKSVLGKSGNSSVTIELRGLGIQSKHAVIDNSGTQVVIEPSKRAKTIVNGKAISSRTSLKHLDRIKLGSNTLYLYVGFVSERHRDDQLETYNYDYFQTELAEAAGFSETMMSADDTMPDASTLLVFQEYVNLLPKIYEANAMSEDMKKSVLFEAMVKNLALHDELGRPRKKELIVKVWNQKTNKVWIWSKAKFINRKFMVEDVYAKYQDGETIDMDQNTDPFWDPIEDVFLGSCHVWLTNLAYCMDSVDELHVRNHHGKLEAMLTAKVEPCDIKGNVSKDELIVFDPNELLTKRLDFSVSIPRCNDIKWVMEDKSRGIYCAFKFFEHPKVIQSKTVRNSINPQLDFHKHFTISQVAEMFLDYLQSHAIVIELWGTQAGNEEKGERSSPDGCDIRIHDEDPKKVLQIKQLEDKLLVKENEMKLLRKQRDTVQYENNILQTRIVSLKSGSLSALRRGSLPVYTRNPLSHSLSHPPPPHPTHPHRPTALLPGAGPQITKLPPLSLSPINSHHTPNNRQKSPRLTPTPKRPSKSHSRSVSIIAKPAATIGDSATQNVANGNVGAPPQQGSSQGQSSSMDGEIAKALKVFFRDVKGVQKKMAELKNLDTESTKSKNSNVQAMRTKHETLMSEVDDQLGSCVSSLKDSMLSVIRRKKEEDARTNSAK